MATITGARAYVDVGTVPPRRRTVLDVVTVRSVSDPHLLLGAEYESVLCGAAGSTLQNCAPTGTAKFSDVITPITGDPFAAYVALQCAPFGHSPEEMLDMAEEALRYKEPRAVENGLRDVFLSKATTVGAGPMSPAMLVAELDLGLQQNYAGQGLMFTSPYGATAMLAANVVTMLPDRTLVTASGTEVIVGGFDVEAAQIWAFASGWVTLLKGPLFTALAPMNTAGMTNTTTALAERTWVPLIDCGALKGEVDTTP